MKLKQLEPFVYLGIGIGLSIFFLFTIIMPQMERELAECAMKNITCVFE